MVSAAATAATADYWVEKGKGVSFCRPHTYTRAICLTLSPQTSHLGVVACRRVRQRCDRGLCRGAHALGCAGAAPGQGGRPLLLNGVLQGGEGGGELGVWVGEGRNGRN